MATCNTIAQHSGTQDSALPVDSRAIAGELADREMVRRRLPGAAVIPVSKPTTSHCGHSEEQCHSDHRDGGRSRR